LPSGFKFLLSPFARRSVGERRHGQNGERPDFDGLAKNCFAASQACHQRRELGAHHQSESRFVRWRPPRPPSPDKAYGLLPDLERQNENKTLPAASEAFTCAETFSVAQIHERATQILGAG